jgi:type III pantothenate kinase
VKLVCERQNKMTLATKNILAIDAGNTRVKWGLFDALGAMLEYGNCLNADLMTLKFPLASRAVIANVAGATIKAGLNSLIAKNTPILWVNAQPNACGVSNQYTLDLGADRWAALVAAWHLKNAPCVVVNAGTAVTIDALSTDALSTDALSIEQNNPKNQAVFIGGLILPGLNLMQQSLGLATAQLPKFEASSHSVENLTADIFAKNTADAIYSGALLAITGAITLMAHELHNHSKQVPFVVLSGGNAPVIYQQLIKQTLTARITQPAIMVDNLVLQGLYLLEKFQRDKFHFDNVKPDNLQLDNSKPVNLKQSDT